MLRKQPISTKEALDEVSDRPLKTIEIRCEEFNLERIGKIESASEAAGVPTISVMGTYLLLSIMSSQSHRQRVRASSVACWGKEISVLVRLGLVTLIPTTRGTMFTVPAVRASAIKLGRQLVGSREGGRPRGSKSN